MKVLVCGGRDYDDEPRVFDMLDRFHAKHGITLLLHGAARGADLLAEKWAKDREIPYLGNPARWKALGKRGGPERNERMLVQFYKPECVIAFPGGNGTTHMCRIAGEAGITVYRIPARTLQAAPTSPAPKAQ